MAEMSKEANVLDEAMDSIDYEWAIRFAMRHLDPERARDAVQDACLALFDWVAEEHPSRESTREFFRQELWNRIHTTQRILSRGRYQAWDGRDPWDPRLDPAWLATLKEVSEVMNRLGPKLGRPAALVFLHGLTREEAGKRLGLSVQAVSRRLVQARKELRTLLEDWRESFRESSIARRVEPPSLDEGVDESRSPMTHQP